MNVAYRAARKHNFLTDSVIIVVLVLPLFISKGITNTSLTKDNIMVLGNMCCTLDGPYISNSDPSILDNLKNCPDLTDAQASTIQDVLLRGKTQFGYASSSNAAAIQP